jgi:hypothetical protein
MTRRGLLSALCCCVVSALLWWGIIAFAASVTTLTVSCSGTGTRPPSLTALPSLLAFGAVDSGTVVILPLTIRNSGGGTLVGTVRRKASCSPDYQLWQAGVPVTSIPYSLPAGATLSIQVRFAPTMVGPQACDIEVGP